MGRSGLFLGAFAIATGGVATACSPKASRNDSSSEIIDAGVDRDDRDPARRRVVSSRLSSTTGGRPLRLRASPVQAELVSSRTNVQEMMFAAGEMQTSGEPFAQHFAGRNLNNYDRTFLPPDEYLLSIYGDAAAVDGAVFDPGYGEILASGGRGLVLPIKDLFGFSTAVESYEYSKMHMNMVANQTTAGLSLANGPIISARAEPTPFARLVARSAELLTSAGSDVAQYAQLPAPANNNQNYLGFAGLWPNFAPFASFDPTMQPSSDVVKSCTLAGGYGGIPTIGAQEPEFECAYNSLHLLDREAQVTKTLVPAVLGFSTWKEALWSIDFSGRLHDSGSNLVNTVATSDMPLVGTKGNNVLGTDPPGAAAGTFLGSTPLENMWGLFMLDEMDNVAEYLISSLSTADGSALSGFPSRLAATQYDYDSPLRWFPAATAVTEDVDDSGVNPYPSVASTAITDPTSRSVDLSALLLGNALFFGETDPRNAGVGQRIGLLLTFDGDPFPADDGVADGEATAHDRTLALLRIAFIDLDRMHTVPVAISGQAAPAAAVTVATATVANAVVTPGSTVTLTNLAHGLVGLRQTILSLNGVISQYGAADPDPSTDLLGILNPIPIHPSPLPDVDAGATPLFSARVRQVFLANATLLRDVLTRSDGTVANGATVVNGVLIPSAGTATLDSQAAAVRRTNRGVPRDERPDVSRRQARLVATRLPDRVPGARRRKCSGTPMEAPPAVQPT